MKANRNISEKKASATTSKDVSEKEFKKTFLTQRNGWVS